MTQRITGAFGEILVTPDTQGRSAPHFHVTHAIGVCRSGGGTLFTAGKRWIHSVGTVVVTNPFFPHWGRPSADGLDYCLLYPDPRWLTALPALNDESPAFWFDNPVINDRPLAGALLDAFDALAQREDERWLAQAVNTLFARYAQRAAPEEAAKWPDNAPSSQANAARNSSIASLAAESGLSRAYYSRMYRKHVGLSPLDHRRQVRVLAARSMIESGASLADAATEAGFADQAHMTRQFRQLLGSTPTAYRPIM